MTTTIVTTENNTLGTLVPESERAAVALLMHGKSAELDAFLSGKHRSDADVAAVVSGARALAAVAGKADAGVAVGVYALRTVTGESRKVLGARLGVNESRISQLSLAGNVFAVLGLPEGWKSAKRCTRQEILSLCSRSGAKVISDILADAGTVEAKREAIAAGVRSLRDETAAILAPQVETTPELSSGPSVDETDDPTASETADVPADAWSKANLITHMSALAEAVTFLATHTARVKGTDRAVIAQAAAVLAGEYPVK